MFHACRQVVESAVTPHGKIPPPLLLPWTCLEKVPHRKNFSRALVCLGSRRQGKYLSVWALHVWWQWKLQNTGLWWCHRHPACPSCCCIWPASWFLQICGWDVLRLLQAQCLTSDTSGNQARRGIPNGLSLQAAGEASDSSSCMERPSPSPVSLYSECQVGLTEGK